MMMMRLGRTVWTRTRTRISMSSKKRYFAAIPTDKSSKTPPPQSGINVDQEDEEDMVEMFNEETGEWNGPRGLEPTRYGDWESKGRCWDF